MPGVRPLAVGAVDPARPAGPPPRHLPGVAVQDGRVAAIADRAERGGARPRSAVREGAAPGRRGRRARPRRTAPAGRPGTCTVTPSPSRATRRDRCAGDGCRTPPASRSGASRRTYSLLPPSTVHHWCWPVSPSSPWLRKKRRRMRAGNASISLSGVDQIAPQNGRGSSAGSRRRGRARRRARRWSGRRRPSPRRRVLKRWMSRSIRRKPGAQRRSAAARTGPAATEARTRCARRRC